MGMVGLQVQKKSVADTLTSIDGKLYKSGSEELFRNLRALTGWEFNGSENSPSITNKGARLLAFINSNPSQTSSK